VTGREKVIEGLREMAAARDWTPGEETVALWGEVADALMDSSMVVTVELLPILVEKRRLGL
jgi:hypothetical protein